MAAQPQTSRLELAADSNWEFLLGDPSGAEARSFQDVSWRRVDLPHDWSIEGPFDAENPTGGGGGFLPAGIGWYRKSFTVPAADRGKRVSIDFDGVMASSDVWINGRHLGHRPYGYSSFEYDLTPYLAPGRNVLAVRVDHTESADSRWYTGSGIYRHARLVVADTVHVPVWGVHVVATDISKATATVNVSTTIDNGRGVDEYVTTKSNADGMEKLTAATRERKNGLVFCNLVDFDMLYGHRKDVEGFARSLEEFDAALTDYLALLGEWDLLILTADHGCDPDLRWETTDHSREYVPIVAYAPRQRVGRNLGTRATLADMGQTVAENFGGKIPHGIGFGEELGN